MDNARASFDTDYSAVLRLDSSVRSCAACTSSAAASTTAIDGVHGFFGIDANKVSPSTRLAAPTSPTTDSATGMRVSSIEATMQRGAPFPFGTLGYLLMSSTSSDDGCADDLLWTFSSGAQNCAWTEGRAWRCSRTAGNVAGGTPASEPCPVSCNTCPIAASSTQDFDVRLDGGEYPDEVSWRVGEGGTTYAYPFASPQTISLPDGENTLHMFDSYGDGWNDASWTLKEAGGEVVVAGPYTFTNGASATRVFTAWTVTLPTSVPTALPTNVGDTNNPTASPTTPTSTFSPASNWNQLSNKCGTSACNTANGGCDIILSGNFVMGSYTGEISFSGKAITLWGQEKVLDAAGGGRFFSGVGAGSFLELQDAILQNGLAFDVCG
jgi:hypothetical protein